MDKSIEFFKKAINLNPDNGWLFENLAEVYLADGHKGLAASYFQTACGLRYEKACVALRQMGF